jgi:hypothetical protein
MYLPATTAILLALGSCQALSTQLETQDVVIISGTSFGECLGYCRTELRVDGEEARFTRSTWNQTAPEQTQAREVGETEWNELLSNVDPATFESLEDVYGCPDCADGGAEWVEIAAAGLNKRVTFEFGSPPPELEPLVERLGELRAEFLAIAP